MISAGGDKKALMYQLMILFVRKPLGLVRDFNHVFSNLGYCVFGLLFMCIVLFKKLKFESFLEQNKGIHKEEYGVPCQYGLYFAMGLALCMEGVMSSSYHVCPTNVTFQFDTTFMYLIAVLMFMKLYQVSCAFFIWVQKK